MDEKEYERSRARIAADLEKADSELEKAEAELRKARKSAGETLEKVQRSRESVQKFRVLVSALPDAPYYAPRESARDVLHSGEQMAGTLADHSTFLSQLAGASADSTEKVLFAATMNQSTAAAADYVVSTLGWDAGQTCPEVRAVVASLQLPTVLQVRGEISDWLGSLDPLLKAKYLETYSNYEDGEYMSAAHAMRETLDHLLKEILAPDAQVVTAPGWKLRPNTKGPTRRQRIRYAVLGSFEDEGASAEDIEVVDRLMEVGSDIYGRLSDVAHPRHGEWQREHVREYLAIAEGVFTQIKALVRVRAARRVAGEPQAGWGGSDVLRG